MNNYNDYYNYVNNFNGMQTKNNNSVSYDAEPYKAFIRGNLFNNLYESYKNYNTDELNPTNQQDYSLLLVQIYDFVAHELALYLDVNPTDNNAIKLRNDYISMYKEALAQYESTFGPLDLGSQMLDASPWAWDSKIWPWEGNK